MLFRSGHRAGLGLDVVFLDKLNLRRTSMGPDKASAGLNISSDEADAFNAWKKAEKDADEARSASDSANAAANKAKNAFAVLSKNSKATPAQLEEAKKKVEEAHTKAETANSAAEKAREDQSAKESAWKKQMNEDQPASISDFRRYVMLHPIVCEVFDPWYVENDTDDKVAPQPNIQQDPTAKQHNNHLHITIRDPELKEN